MAGATARADNWEQTSGRVALFACAVLTFATAMRELKISSVSAISIDMRNWALMLLAVALPSLAWCMVRRRRARIAAPALDLRGTMLLLCITLSAFGAIVCLRACLEGAALLRTLDLMGALILPMLAGFSLVLLPCLSRRLLVSVAGFAVMICLLAAALQFTVRRGNWPAAPAADSPSHRAISRG